MKAPGNDPDKGGDPNALCGYGNPNVLTLISVHHKARAGDQRAYDAGVLKVPAPLLTPHFNGPVEMVAQCEYVPASQGNP